MWSPHCCAYWASGALPAVCQSIMALFCFVVVFFFSSFGGACKSVGSQQGHMAWIVASHWSEKRRGALSCYVCAYGSSKILDGDTQQCGRWGCVRLFKCLLVLLPVDQPTVCWGTFLYPRILILHFQRNFFALFAEKRDIQFCHFYKNTNSHLRWLKPGRLGCICRTQLLASWCQVSP